MSSTHNHHALFMWLFASVTMRLLLPRNPVSVAMLQVFVLNRIILSCLSVSLVENGLSRFAKIVQFPFVHSVIWWSGLYHEKARLYHSFLFRAPIDLLNIISPISTAVCVLLVGGSSVVASVFPGFSELPVLFVFWRSVFLNSWKDSTLLFIQSCFDVQDCCVVQGGRKRSIVAINVLTNTGRKKTS